MHKLMEYICDELEELERKADKEGKLSMAEIQYADTLAHMKKNLLKSEEMWEDSEYSEAGGSYEGGSYEGSMRGSSYARGGRGGRGGRRGGANQYGSYARGGQSSRGGSYARGGEYSGAADELVSELRELMQSAPDEYTKKEFQKFIQKIEQM